MVLITNALPSEAPVPGAWTVLQPYQAGECIREIGKEFGRSHSLRIACPMARPGPARRAVRLRIPL